MSPRPMQMRPRPMQRPPKRRRTTRRQSLSLLGALLGAVLCTSGCGASASPPDVLLISLDTVRADALTFLDPRVAPHLSRLAERGTIFTQAIAGSSWTLPSHVSMFTGMPPALHGVQDDGLRIDPEVPTLPEMLQQAGWSTAGFWTGWYLAADFGFGRGFDTYANAMTDGLERYEEMEAAVRGGDLEAARQAFFTRHSSSHADVTSPKVVELVGRTLGSLDRTAPLFLFCHLFDPHYDFIPPPPYDTRFDSGYRGKIDGRDFMQNRRIWDEHKNPKRRINDRDLAHVQALYRGEIAWTDAAVGRVLDRLERDGRLDDTLIIVTSDHGEEFFEHGQRGHRRGVFDEVLRVPLLVVPPRGLAGAGVARTVDAAVTLDDLMPTILDYCDLPVPDTVSGRSLRPAVEQGALPDRPALASLLLTGTRPDGKSHAVLIETLRTPQEKFIRNLEVVEGKPPRVAAVAWFDLAQDPQERRPVSDFDDARVRAGWEALETALDGLRAGARMLPRSAYAERLTRISEVFRPDLKALGYLDAPEDDRPAAAWMLEPLPRVPEPWESDG